MLTALCSLLVLTSVSAAGSSGSSSDAPAAGPSSATVVSVYDGDTLTLENGDRVRLRWANTPELKPAEDYGIEAREVTRALCMNQEAQLTYGTVQRDGYGRLLAAVECQGTDLAISLVEQGVAHVFLIPPDDHDPTPLLEAQQRAKDAKRGLWSTERYQGTIHFTSFHANAPGDDRANVNGEYIRACNITDQPVDLAGYRLTDMSGRSFTLPTLLVPAGNTVKLISGKGDNQASPDQQLELYLGSEEPVWNNKRDRATLYDPYGRVVDSRMHEIKSNPTQ